MAKKEPQKCSFCTNPYAFWMTLKTKKDSKYKGTSYKFWICSECDKYIAKVDKLDIIDYQLNSIEKIKEFLENKKEKSSCEVKTKFDEVSNILKENGAEFNLKMDCHEHNESYHENFRIPEAPKIKEKSIAIPERKTVTLDSFFKTNGGN